MVSRLSSSPAPELTGLVGVAADVMDALGELGVAIVIAAENLFPPIPSEVVLPLAGFLAAQGRMSLGWVVLAATLGSVFGAMCLYELGARVPEARIRALLVRVPLLDPRDLDAAQVWFVRYGAAAVLLGRCVPLVRSLVSIPAGLAHMPRWKFAALTFVGSGVWNAVFVGLGFALAARFAEAERLSDWLNLGLWVGLAVAGLLVLRRLLLRHRAGSAT